TCGGCSSATAAGCRSSSATPWWPCSASRWSTRTTPCGRCGPRPTGPPARGAARVVGDAVNVPPRLEQVADPGEVLLGQSTYRLVRDAVSAERVIPLHLKGKGAPVVASRLGQVAPGAPGHARRQDAPIVGREPELRLFAW